MPEKAESDKTPSKKAEKSRLQLLRVERGELFAPSMPPLECGAHMLDHLWAAGPTTGDGPITHCELRAYQDNTGIELSEWEASTLRRLSIAYLNESHAATKRDCPAPWQDGTEGPALTAVDARDSIRALATL